MQIAKHTAKVLKIQVKDWLSRCAGIILVILIPVSIAMLAILLATTTPKATLRCNYANVLSIGSARTQIVRERTLSSVWSNYVTVIDNLQGAEMVRRVELF